MSYHTTAQKVYRDAAFKPARNLCCVPQTRRFLPGLHIPDIMHEMNYGCGTTVHLQDMKPNQTVLYVGIGGGIEALEFAYFTRRPGGVIAIDPVAEMREVAADNLRLAAQTNDWFDPSFVSILGGNALSMPVDDRSVDLAAENCLFNIFKTGGDLEVALTEMHRALKNGGRLIISDPITPRPIPQHVVEDDNLRALCMAGCLPLDDYVKQIVDAGFGVIEIRSRKPYRMLDAEHYGLEDDLLLETIEVAAFKTPLPDDGPCVFTGRVAIYTGPDESFNDGMGHMLDRNMPTPVCDKTASALADREDIIVTESTWHYQSGGCC